MDVHSLGWRTDLALLRLAGSDIQDRGDHLVVRTPDNPGFWWGNFVLAGTEQSNAERWLRTFHAAFPDAAHVAIGLNGPAHMDAYRELGLEVDSSIVLTARELAPPPDGADVRPVVTDAEWEQVSELRLVIDALDGQSGPDHERFVHARIDEFRRLTAGGRGAWFGAFVDGRVRASLGLVDAGDGLARYQSVETHPDFRRRGLARAMLTVAGAYGLDRLGADTLVIGADPDYHAIALYRSLGFADAPGGLQIRVQRAP